MDDWIPSKRPVFVSYDASPRGWSRVVRLFRLLALRRRRTNVKQKRWLFGGRQ
jgi:hypothetical protein